MAVRCFFLELPPEIRLGIYEHLFNIRPSSSEASQCSGPSSSVKVYARQSFDFDTYPAGPCLLDLDEPITKPLSGFEKSPATPNQCNDFTAILRTCKLIEEEATNVLYESTCFYVKVGLRPHVSFDQVSDARHGADGLHCLRRLKCLRLLKHVKVRIVEHKLGEHKLGEPPDRLPDILIALFKVLNPERASTNVVFKLDLVLAAAIARCPSTDWCYFIQSISRVAFGCTPVISVDRDGEVIARCCAADRHQQLADAMNGELDYVVCPN